MKNTECIGKASINIDEAIAGSNVTFTITVEIGDYGVDNTGEILIARRDVCDSEIPQFDNPNLPGYVSVDADTTEEQVKLAASYVTWRYIRPWKACISIKVSDGSLHPGDKVYVTYGSKDKSGYRMQTFAEEKHIFRTMFDCAGSGNFYEVEQSPYIKIKGGFLERLEGVIPSVTSLGEPFDIFVRAVDSFGNISEDFNKKVYVEFANSRFECDVTNGTGKIPHEGLTDCGIYRMTVLDKDRKVRGESNPMQVTEQNLQYNIYWGDMHGQTGETVGTGTPDLYFSFARDKAKLDFSAWQGNDFQVTEETYKKVSDAVVKYNEDNRFVTFLGYEWSGTTPSGGDHNVYYLNDNEPIHRSYRWQMGMNNQDKSDRHTIPKLCEEFKGRDDVMLIPHVGGRYGDSKYWDDSLMHLIEIHSHHGTFEWMLEDALKRGLKPGVWAASDDHTCRPGLSMPTKTTSRGGFVSFDVSGGYGAVFAKELNRESIWDAMVQRRCYATTGKRILPDIQCFGHMMGQEFSVDKAPKFDINVIGTDILDDVQLYRNTEKIMSYKDKLKKNRSKIRITWSGVRIRSRQKKVKWDGTVSIVNGSIGKVKQFAFNQPEEGATKLSNQTVSFVSSTSGDPDGIELELTGGKDPIIEFASSCGVFKTKVSKIGDDGIVFDAGGVNQKVEFSFATIGNDNKFSTCYTDENIKSGCNAYYLRIIQSDGHMAWTSPMYINY